MEITRRKIKVHKSLHDLFGRETTGLDLFAILVGSITLTIIALLFHLDSELLITPKIILAFLTLDIGGGIIANFTEGTNNYYSENIKKRYLFIAIHIVQPLILSWIFPNNMLKILTFTVYTLTSSLIVTTIKQNNAQKTIAATMVLLGIILTFSFSFSTPLLQLILLVYSVKLILAFSVNWTHSK